MQMVIQIRLLKFIFYQAESKESFEREREKKQNSSSIFVFSQENKRRTKHISKNLNPNWDHTVIYGNMHREELQYKMLEFTVWHYDRFKANDFIGQITIDLKGRKNNS